MTATYLIGHTPCSGSLWLCDVLAQNGMGIPDLDRASLFIGYGAGIAQDWDARLSAFFEGNRNADGVCGMKTDFAYLEHLAQHIRPFDFKQALFSRFTHYILLQREDVVEQAVSWYLAQATGQYTSLDVAHGPVPDYDADRIGALIERIEAENARWAHVVDAQDAEPLLLTYESLSKFGGMARAVRAIGKHLGVSAPRKIDSGDLEKLDNPLQAEFVARWKEDHG